LVKKVHGMNKMYKKAHDELLTIFYEP